MKVLVNAISAKKGGIVTYTTNLLKDLPKHGIDLKVAVPETFIAPEGTEDRLIRVPASEFPPTKRLIWEQTIWRGIVKRENPDLLFSSANFGLLFSPVPQLLLLREGGLFDDFYLVNMTFEQGVRSAVLRYWRRKMMMLSAKSANKIITPTAGMRDLLGHWLPSSVMARCEVNWYGTLSDAFSPRGRKRAWREDGVLRLLYVSVYYPHKNPSVIVEAAKLLQEQGVDTQVTITMNLDEIAATPGGDYDLKVLRDAERDGYVTLGRVQYNDLPQVYASHDVFVFPSISETFGHPMAEAMSMSLPILATGTQVNREICDEAAVYFSPFQPSSLAEAVQELNESPEKVVDMGRLGRERALTKFRWNDHVERLVHIFKNTLKT